MKGEASALSDLHGGGSEDVEFQLCFEVECFLSCSSGGASGEALSLHPDPSHCQPLLGSLPDRLQSWGRLCLQSLGALN